MKEVNPKGGREWASNHLIKNLGVGEPPRFDIGRLGAPSAFLEPWLKPLFVRVTSETWANTQDLRNAITHRTHKRGVYGSTRQPPDPEPLAHPQHVDLEWGSGGKMPLDTLLTEIVRFAEETFTEFCGSVNALVRQ